MNSRAKTLFMVVGIIVLGIGGVIAYAAIRSGMDSSNQDKEPATKNNTSQTENSTTDNKPSTDTEKTTDVMVMDFAYSPASITVKKGTTVTWTNHDDVEHTVTSTDDSPVSFDSGLFGKDESFSFTFNEVGTYTYFCMPHPYMKGTVTVTE